MRQIVVSLKFNNAVQIEAWYWLLSVQTGPLNKLSTLLRLLDRRCGYFHIQDVSYLENRVSASSWHSSFCRYGNWINQEATVIVRGDEMRKSL